ncbi:unnamed protein product, partial [Polarella glacialis]
MSLRFRSPCGRSTCQHCGQSVALLYLDGLGIRRRRHERLCLQAKESSGQRLFSSEVNRVTAYSWCSEISSGSGATASFVVEPSGQPSCSSSAVTGGSGSTKGSVRSGCSANSRAASSDNSDPAGLPRAAGHQASFEINGSFAVSGGSSSSDSVVRRRESAASHCRRRLRSCRSANDSEQANAGEAVANAHQWLPETRPTASAALALAAIWLQAPVIAGSLALYAAAAWLNQGRSRDMRASLLAGNSPQVQTQVQHQPQHWQDISNLATQNPQNSGTLSLGVASEATVGKVAELVRGFHIRAALHLAERSGLLGLSSKDCSSNLPPDADVSMREDLLHLLSWLQRLASPARLAFQGLQVPPPEGEGWLGPVECSDSSWQMSLWYRWSSSTVISTVSRLSLPGNLCE